MLKPVLYQGGSSLAYILLGDSGSVGAFTPGSNQGLNYFLLVYQNLFKAPFQPRYSINVSEKTTALELLAYFVGVIPGIYFTYRILVELYYYLTRKDEEIV